VANSLNFWQGEVTPLKHTLHSNHQVDIKLQALLSKQSARP